MDISGIRREYQRAQLDESDVSKDPISQFKHWFDDALKAEVNEPNAMNLATINDKGMPSSRIVLLKGVEQGGFVFYSNYESNKGRHLHMHPRAALCFFWPELERQVRIEGSVSKIDPKESDAYFRSRPFESRLGSWVSEQSQVIKSRAELEQKLEEVKRRFTLDVPRPLDWGGYILIPDKIEFWQGRANRLHDRILYTSDKLNNWKINRLAP